MSKFIRKIFYCVVQIAVVFYLPSPFPSTCYGASVEINDDRTATQILDNLYSGPDKTAEVTASGSVAVPGGTVTNNNSVSGTTGIYHNLGGSVVNSGQISATGGAGNYGVYLGNGAGAVNAVTNNAGATIAGAGSGAIGIRAFVVEPFTLDNSGTIYGRNERAILSEGHAGITNRTGGQIIGGYGGTAGTAIHVTTSATIQNDGTITGNGGTNASSTYGIYAGTTGNVTNTVNGVITGGGKTVATVSG